MEVTTNYSTPLTPRLIFGPFLKSREDYVALVRDNNVRVVVHMGCKDAKTYTKYNRDRDMPAVPIIIEKPFKKSDAKSRFKEEQLNIEARNYIRYGREVFEALGDSHKEVIYIHYEKGTLEEAYVGFILWRLMDPRAVPENPIAWIAENNRKWVFEENPDKEHMMMLIWELMKKEEGSTKDISKFFIIKKRRVDDNNVTK